MAIKKIYKNIYSIESNINNGNQIDSVMRNKKSLESVDRSNEEEKYKHLSSLQLTKEECRVLNFLKKKEQKESRKYQRRYSNE